MKQHIDHIAFRVKDVNKAVKHYTQTHKFEVLQEMDLMVQGKKVRSFVLRQGQMKPYIFISQGAKGSIVSNWVKEHGNAMHHIAFIVDDINKEVARLKRKKVKFTTKKPIGTHKFYQIFSIPNKETGLIHEIIERNNRNTFFNENNVKELMESTAKFSKAKKLKLSHD